MRERKGRERRLRAANPPTISVRGEPKRVNLVVRAEQDYLLWDIFFHLRSETWTQWTIAAAWAKVHHRPFSFEDGLVVYPANAFDSRMQGDQVPLGSNPTKSQLRLFARKRKRKPRKKCLARCCRLHWLEKLPRRALAVGESPRLRPFVNSPNCAKMERSMMSDVIIECSILAITLSSVFRTSGFCLNCNRRSSAFAVFQSVWAEVLQLCVAKALANGPSLDRTTEDCRGAARACSTPTICANSPGVRSHFFTNAPRPDVVWALHISSGTPPGQRHPVYQASKETIHLWSLNACLWFAVIGSYRDQTTLPPPPPPCECNAPHKSGMYQMWV